MGGKKKGQGKMRVREQEEEKVKWNGREGNDP